MRKRFASLSKRASEVGLFIAALLLLSKCAPTLVTQGTNATRFTDNVADAVLVACADNNPAQSPSEAAAASLAAAARAAANKLETATREYNSAVEAASPATVAERNARVQASRDLVTKLMNDRANVAAGDMDSVYASDLNAPNLFDRSGAAAHQKLIATTPRVNSAREKARDAVDQVAANSAATPQEIQQAREALARAEAATSRALQAVRDANQALIDQGLRPLTDYDASNTRFMEASSNALRATWEAEAASLDAQLVLARVQVRVAEKAAAEATQNSRDALAQATTNLNAAMAAAAEAAARAYNQLNSCGGVPPAVPNIPGYFETFWDIASP